MRADSRALHHQHPCDGQNGCLIEHLEIVRRARARLRRKRGVVTPLVWDIVLIALYRGDRPLRACVLVRVLVNGGRSAHVMGVVARFPGEEWSEYKLGAMGECPGSNGNQEVRTA